MALPSGLSDVSSDSLPLLFLALFAHGVRYLRSILTLFLHSIGFTVITTSASNAEAGFLACAVGSGLAGVIALAERLHVCHRAFTCRQADSFVGSDCAVCLRTLSPGDHLRMLACTHVFHRHCVDTWLHYGRSTCPLCRSPLVPDHHLSQVRSHVTRDLLTGLPHASSHPLNGFA